MLWIFAVLVSLWLGGSFGFLLGAWWADAQDIGRARKQKRSAGYAGDPVAAKSSAPLSR